MARSARTVVCPLCDAPNVTRAAPGFRLRCKACSSSYRVPFPDGDETPVGRIGSTAPPRADQPEASAPPATPAPDPSPPAAAGSGPVVARATPVAGAPAADPAPELDQDDDGHAEQMYRRQVEAGRRGGRASALNRMVRRG